MTCGDIFTTDVFWLIDFWVIDPIYLALAFFGELYTMASET
jgi:hypothetical protein